MNFLSVILMIAREQYESVIEKSQNRRLPVLALRNAKAYDSSNEIGQLYSGDTVQLIDSSDAQYWYVYSPKLYLYGYVNKDYLY